MVRSECFDWTSVTELSESPASCDLEVDWCVLYVVSVSSPLSSTRRAPLNTPVKRTDVVARMLDSLTCHVVQNCQTRFAYRLAYIPQHNNNSRWSFQGTTTTIRRTSTTATKSTTTTVVNITTITAAAITTTTSKTNDYDDELMVAVEMDIILHSSLTLQLKYDTTR